MGFEPTTPCMPCRCSTGLSYGPVFGREATNPLLDRVQLPAHRAHGSIVRRASDSASVRSADGHAGELHRSGAVRPPDDRAELAGPLARRGHLRGRQRRPPAHGRTSCACTRIPAAPAHMGHVRNYTFGDLLVRYRTMQGQAVLSPIGFDSFGLPAENAAIKTGEHPRTFTDARIEELTSVPEAAGRVLRLAPEVTSHDPSYIRWTQWIFLRFLEAGLAYRAEAPVNWCPGCQTVLANEQVLADGTCERSGDLVERRNLEQWFFKITDYAEQLLDDIDAARLARAGQDHAAQLDRPLRGRRVPTCPSIGGTRTWRWTSSPPVRTPSFGMTYAVVAPEHPLVPELTTDDQREEVEAFVAQVRGGERAGPPELGAARWTSAASSPAPTPSTRSTATRSRSTWPTTCWPPTAPGRSWPCPARTSGTGTSPRPTTCRSSAPSSHPRTATARRTRARGPAINSRVAGRPGRAEAKAQGHRLAGGAGDRRAHGQLPPAGLAAVPPALLGLPDPGRLLRRAAASSPSPTRTCRCSPPTTSSSCRPASRR